MEWLHFGWFLLVRPPIAKRKKNLFEWTKFIKNLQNLRFSQGVPKSSFTYRLLCSILPWNLWICLHLDVCKKVTKLKDVDGGWQHFILELEFMQLLINLTYIYCVFSLLYHVAFSSSSLCLWNFCILLEI
jgi:hypothetical protein